MINYVGKHHPSLQKGVQYMFHYFSSFPGLVVFQNTWKGKQPHIGKSLTLEMQVDSSVNWLPFYSVQ